MSQTMAMQTIQLQTLEIVQCLFEVDLGCIEVDGVKDGDKFDPVPIANKLREVADRLQTEWDRELPAALLQLNANQEKDISVAFSHAVDSVCRNPAVGQGLPEMQLITAAVALCLYLKRSAPERQSNIQQATVRFLDTRVASFVAQQGGWDAVTTTSK